MNRNDNNGASDTDDPSHPDVSSPHKDRLPKSLEKKITHRESVVTDDQADALSREKLVTARENAVHLREGNATSREDTAHQREGKATTREQQIRVAKTIQAASDDHMIMLQQANTHLVIATIEAQKLAEQVQTATAQLEIAKAAAEKANLAKSDFLSSMSHELRTPLNAILGFAQLLEAGSPPPTAIQIVRLNQIIKAGWYLLELINEILDLALIESGKLSLSQEPVSLIDVMSECRAMIEPQAQQRNIKLTFLPFDNTCFVYADRTRVKQILINLLSNAIKYNREQGTVEIKCTANVPERIRVSIKDSGAGLPPEKLAQLFQPFNRLGQETGNVEGTGIGLVVTKQLIELMGGAIGVDSTVGVGSEFWIELIRDVTPQHADSHKLPKELAPQAQENTALFTLLYVEDNPANLMLVEQIIDAYPQVHMLSACDGNLGIALARAHLPDVILMDINLPGISGIEALRILREDQATARIPVIALSANAMPRDIEKGLKAGFFRYLTKPIKINEFMNALDNALKFSEMGLVNTNKTGQIR
ncbi:MAG: hybrid sensor histidine kinase/response regulator [Methylobacter sp.]